MNWILIFLLIGMQSIEAAPVPPLSTAQQVRDHWAFQPVANPAPPKVDPGWVQNAVDQFVLRRLTLADMKPSKRADRRTLIRRATMDLTGLMPTYAEVQQFVADDTPEAWPKLIDRLLASPHYGERWARHGWMWRGTRIPVATGLAGVTEFIPTLTPIGIMWCARSMRICRLINL